MPRTMTRAKHRAAKSPKTLAIKIRARKKARKREEPYKFQILYNDNLVFDPVSVPR
jgi:hypothetical protein